MFNLVLDKPLKRRFSDVLQNNLSKKFHKALRKTRGPLLKKLWSYRLELYKKTKLRHGFAAYHFEKFLRETILQYTSAWMLLYRRSGACNFIKKETLTDVFSCEFCENFTNTFFTEQLSATASIAYYDCK